jgi:uncharacterized protein
LTSWYSHRPSLGAREEILPLGEAKWDRVMDLRHIERLRRARDLLAVAGFDTQRGIGAGVEDRQRGDWPVPVTSGRVGAGPAV